MSANPASIIRDAIDDLGVTSPPVPTSYRDLDDEHLTHAYYAVEALKGAAIDMADDYHSQIQRGDMIRLPGLEAHFGSLGAALEAEAILIEIERRKRQTGK